MFKSVRAHPASAETRSQILPWGPWGRSSGSTAGIAITEDSAIQLLTVYGCVQLIADTIATLPIQVYREGNDLPVEATKPSWLRQPNEYTSIVDFITQSLWSLLLDGNAYWVYGLNRAFSTTNLTILDPCKVTVDHQRMADLQRPGALIAPKYLVNGEPFAGKLVHIRGIMRPGHIKGVSPIEAAREAVGLGLAAQQFAGHFYSNGTALSGVISTAADLTEDQARKLQAGWALKHGGLHNAHKPGVLDNGATWAPTSVTPEQAQFLETRNFQAAEIAGQMFLLDPTLLGIAVSRGQNLTYANLEQRGIHLVQFTLLRWIIRLETAFNQLLPAPQYVKFNVSAIERADLLTRYQAHRIALGPNVAWETVEEVRDLEELGPVPDDLEGQQNTPAEPAPAFVAPPPAVPPTPAQSNGHQPGVKV